MKEMHAESALTSAGARPLIDPFGRRIRYLRMSVTDRCDLRCRYCMAERMTFLPRTELLSFEELEAVADAFIRRGLKKLRLTGGEPLVRRDILHLVERLGARIGESGLEELTLTTNGTRLAEFAGSLARAGVRRVNVSLDSLDAERFRYITRRGELADVLAGIDTAAAAGLQIKINMVALKGLNDGEIVPMLRWAHERGHDLTLIETMPLGEVEEDRADRYLPLSQAKAEIDKIFTLEPLAMRSGGPARYWRVAETGGHLGLITPLTHNFCEDCNRVRLTATGTLFLCLGQEDAADLRSVLRTAPGDAGALDAALDAAILRKPKGHDFVISRGAAPAVSRHMSMTGG